VIRFAHRKKSLRPERPFCICVDAQEEQAHVKFWVRFMVFKRVGSRVSAALVLILAAAAALAQVPSAQHVVLVIDENASFDDVIVNMPWLVGQGNLNGYAANYEFDSSGSLLDYLWLTSGSCHSSAHCTLPAGTHDFNCNGNNCYYPGTSISDPITDDNIFRELNNAGISWKVYAQSYAAAGGSVTSPDKNNGTSYYRRHNGATWYSDILNDVNGSAENIVDLSQLTTDLESGTLPRFMIIVPDGNHDAHDCPVGMSTCSEAQKLAAADAFLSDTLNPILSTTDFQPGGDGLLIVTFDEWGGCTNYGCGAAVYTALIGPRVVWHSFSSVAYKHENTLRTMLDSLGVKTYPGASATAADMSDFFAVNGSNPEVIIRSPANGASLNSPVAIQASAYPTEGHVITGWWVYVDSASTYNAGAASAIDPTIKMSSGVHTIVVRAWDSSGAFGDQTITLMTVNTGVTVSSPITGGTYTSPVHFAGSAATGTCAAGIASMGIYTAPGQLAYVQNGAALDTQLPLSPGTYNTVVQAWDNCGGALKTPVTITVSSGGGSNGVFVSSPINNSSVSSPVHFAATATTTTCAAGIASMGIYTAPGILAYIQNGNTLDTLLPLAVGTYNAVVQAWDNCGGALKTAITITVSSGGGSNGVFVSSPINNASVSSPVHFAATATTTTCAAGIASMGIYTAPGVLAYVQNGAALDTQLPLSSTSFISEWPSLGIR
jgi:Phosphoesterase family